MSHIAIQESKDGKNVEWLEKVTDQQYQWGDPALTIKAGDIVWIPPGIKH